MFAVEAAVRKTVVPQLALTDIRNQQVFRRDGPILVCIKQHFQVEKLPSGPVYSQCNKPASFALCKFNFFCVVSLLKTDVHNGCF